MGVGVEGRGGRSCRKRRSAQALRLEQAACACVVDNSWNYEEANVARVKEENIGRM